MIEKTKNYTATTPVLTDSAFTATVTGQDFDISGVYNISAYFQASTASSGSPVMTAKLQVKDPITGVYFDHTTVSPTLIPSGAFKYDFGAVVAKTARLMMTFSGSGGITHTYVTLAGKSC